MYIQSPLDNSKSKGSQEKFELPRSWNYQKERKKNSNYLEFLLYYFGKYIWMSLHKFYI